MRNFHRMICVFLCACFLWACNTKYEYNTSSAPDNSDYTRKSAEIRLEDDFYGYTNFDFLWSNSIPADMSEYSDAAVIRMNIDSYLSDKIISVSECVTEYPDNSDEKKIQVFYRQFLDSQTRNRSGLSALYDGLHAVEKSDNIDEFVSACGLLYRQYGCSVIFRPSVSADLYDNSRYMLYIDQMDLVNSASELLETDGSAENEQQIIAALLDTYGYSNSDRAAYDIVSMLLDIAENTEPLEKASFAQLYNKFTASELHNSLRNIDMSAYLCWCGAKPADSMVIYDVRQAECIDRHLTNENLELWKCYAISRLLYEYSSCLPDEYDRIFAAVNGNQSIRENAVKAVKKYCSDELSNFYIKDFCDSQTVMEVTGFAEYIRKAYRDVILSSENISETEREQLISKLNNITFKIGYPQKLQNTAEIHDNLLDNAVAVKCCTVSENLALYGKDVDIGLWKCTPYTFNAFYTSFENSITIPAAVFSKPFFNINAQLQENLGGLGFIIAHEMTHAFDSSGIQFDWNGCYNPDWIKSDRTERTKKAAEDYFGKQQIMNGFIIDGKLTADENIADIGSMYVISSVTDNPTELKTLFESYARRWAVLAYADEAAESLHYDEHSPAEIRINAVLSSTDKFYYAYEITENDGMYAEPQKRVRVW